MFKSGGPCRQQRLGCVHQPAQRLAAVRLQVSQAAGHQVQEPVRAALTESSSPISPPPSTQSAQRPNCPPSGLPPTCLNCIMMLSTPNSFAASSRSGVPGMPLARAPAASRRRVSSTSCSLIDCLQLVVWGKGGKWQARAVQGGTVVTLRSFASRPATSHPCLSSLPCRPAHPPERRLASA